MSDMWSDELPAAESLDPEQTVAPMGVSCSASPPIGAVAVVGAGIAGIESSLDLADAGYLVHLVTEDPYIGGRMARLDKTFPTNDCAMCMLGPRMTQVQNHPNIVVHTQTDVLGLTGLPGDFTLQLRQRPRFVSQDECTACGDCEPVCPVVIKDPYNEYLGTHKAIHRPFPQAVPNKYRIEKPGMSPCRLACPSGVNIQGFVALIRSGKPAQAWELIREAIPFPIICGTVCTHPCEIACQRGELDEPLDIPRLKRYAGEYALEHLAELYPDGPPLPPIDGENGSEAVAVVGSGPAGLSAAYHLVRRGYRPTVFEALDQIGGMMRVGIPPYRLPRNLLDAELELLSASGVVFRTGTGVGRDVTLDGLLSSGFAAVILAIGAHEAQRAGVPGEDRPGVRHGVSFLREACLGRCATIGRRVIVVGGGNTAVDSARTALRLGAEKVTVLYRRTAAEMTALPEEVLEAEEEGVEFRFLVSPLAVLGSGGAGPVTGLRAIRNRLGEPDADGRRRPVAVPDGEFDIEADTIVFAISQAPDQTTLAGTGLARTRRGTIEADPLTLVTSRRGVFAAGDAVTGPATVIEALASGKAAALSVHRYLRRLDLAAGRQLPLDPRAIPRMRLELEDEPKLARERPSRLSPSERRTGFAEVVGGLTAEQALRESERCLSCGGCSECRQCVAACPKDAIQHSDKEKHIELRVGAVVTATGFSLLDPRTRPELGYGTWPNVVTAAELERMLSATGPWQGDVRRPSDGRHPSCIALIQCVGSRENREPRPVIEHGATDGPVPYCSTICCLYTAKQALMIREHLPSCHVTVFHHDLRAVGKGFDRYLHLVQERGVRYVRSLPAAVRYRPEQQTLDLSYVSPGEPPRVAQEEFDMVVLAAGVRPSAGQAALAKALQLDLDVNGFVANLPGKPVSTTREGVLVAGGAQRPLDIPESVISAAGAAAEAASLLAQARGQLTRTKRYPPERDVRGAPAKIGVFVCRCGTNIGSVVDVPAVVAAAASCPNVAVAEERVFACSQESLAAMGEAVAKQDLNRILIASCTVRTHLSLFRESAREAALNEFLVDMCNIREQCSWVHRDNPAMATAKAADLVRMGVAKVARAEPLTVFPVPVVARCLVLGGGLAGLTAASNLASQGFEVSLVERENELGGNLRRMPHLAAELGIDINGLARRVRSNPRVTVYTGTQLADFGGHTGHFRSRLRRPAGDLSTGDRETIEIEHGVLIIATGGTEYRPVGEYPALEAEAGDPATRPVKTRLEFESRARDTTDDRTYVFVQCAGGRTPSRDYCSRTCCAQTMRDALRLLQSNPERRIYVLYRDIRTYGKHEELYLAAREAGVTFVRYSAETPPLVDAVAGDTGTGRQRARVLVRDDDLNADLELLADSVVLATPVQPQTDARELARLLKVPLDQDGFFSELHPKLSPLDLPSQGIYLCGLAHAPKDTVEVITQALGAAARAATILSRRELLVGGIVATVDADRCAACLTCVRVCPYDVPAINEDGVAVINPVDCRGCGTCAAECPGKAIHLPGYRDDQMMAMMKAIMVSGTGGGRVAGQ